MNLLPLLRASASAHAKPKCPSSPTSLRSHGLLAFIANRPSSPRSPFGTTRCRRTWRMSCKFRDREAFAVGPIGFCIWMRAKPFDGVVFVAEFAVAASFKYCQETHLRRFYFDLFLFSGGVLSQKNDFLVFAFVAFFHVIYIQLRIVIAYLDHKEASTGCIVFMA